MMPDPDFPAVVWAAFITHGLSSSPAVHCSKGARLGPRSPICEVSPKVGCIAVEAIANNSRDTRGKWTSRPSWGTIGERPAYSLLWFRNFCFNAIAACSRDTITFLD